MIAKFIHGSCNNELTNYIIILYCLIMFIYNIVQYHC